MRVLANRGIIRGVPHDVLIVFHEKTAHLGRKAFRLALGPVEEPLWHADIGDDHRILLADMRPPSTPASGLDCHADVSLKDVSGTYGHRIVAYLANLW